MPLSGLALGCKGWWRVSLGGMWCYVSLGQEGAIPLGSDPQELAGRESAIPLGADPQELAGRCGEL